LENATLGRILGFDTFMCQNVNCVLTGADISATAMSVTEAYPAGTTGALAAASVAAEPVNGEFFTVTGNDQPTYITSHIDATSITLNEALKYAVEDNAVVYRYKSCAANAGYAKGYSKAVVVKSYTTGKAPQVGQLVAFDADGAHRHTYTVIESEDAGATCALYLDRPLDYAVSENDAVFPGPTGSMNLAFHRDALALVTRPLALPDTRMGVMAAVVPLNGIGMRVLMQYDINAGGTVVNCDILAGVAVLDSGLLVPMLG
jgi:hypothetical protein